MGYFLDWKCPSPDAITEAAYWLNIDLFLWVEERLVVQAFHVLVKFTVIVILLYSLSTLLDCVTQLKFHFAVPINSIPLHSCEIRQICSSVVRLVSTSRNHLLVQCQITFYFVCSHGSIWLILLNNENFFPENHLSQTFSSFNVHSYGFLWTMVLFVSCHVCRNSHQLLYFFGRILFLWICSFLFPVN